MALQKEKYQCQAWFVHKLTLKEFPTLLVLFLHTVYNTKKSIVMGNGVKRKPNGSKVNNK